jgi:hypothetical protein
MSTNSNQTNGNTQLNSERNRLNSRVDNFRMLSKTKKVQWDSMRRHRTI